MPGDPSDRPSPEAVDAFLGTGGTGVLALASGDDPYAVPVSYGYDADARRFVFRLGFADGSEKRAFVSDGSRARFVVYGREGGRWRSVVATGTLRAVDEGAVDAAVVRGLREAALPLRGIFDAPEDEIEFALYALEVDDLSGRTAAADGA